MLKTKISKLANGFQIATHETSGHFASAGIFVKAGSRHEKIHLRGCNSFTDKLTFKSTYNYKSQDLVKEFEKIGGQIASTAHREYYSIQGSVFKKDLDTLLNLFSDVIRRPLLNESEILDAKTNTEFEINQEEFKYDLNLPDKLHQIAYRNTGGDPTSLSPHTTNTLGNTNRITRELLESMSSDKLIEFRQLFSPDRMVLASVGANHDEMVELAERLFGDMKIVDGNQLLDIEPVYTGGTFINNTHKKSPNPDDMVLTHLQIAYEAPGILDPDIYSLATLGSLLGGGGSFSAGGPGKGMYTRLYTQVLNRNGWVENCNVFNHSYIDSGLFGIHCAVPSDIGTHEHVGHVVCDQLITCTTKCTRDELDRAKNQLKSSLLMALESQVVELEDIGRQVLANSQRMSVAEMCERIDLVSASDVIRIGRRVFLGEDTPSSFQFPGSVHWTCTGDWRPTVLVEGPLLNNDPLYKIDETIGKWGLNNDNTDSSVGRTKKRRSFFSKY